MILVRFRQGIGLDIEYNDDICHRVAYEEDEEGLLMFMGILLKIPFFTIYIGEFIEDTE
jgi:hypothetical protein